MRAYRRQRSRGASSINAFCISMQAEFFRSAGRSPHSRFSRDKRPRAPPRKETPSSAEPRRLPTGQTLAFGGEDQLHDERAPDLGEWYPDVQGRGVVLGARLEAVGDIAVHPSVEQSAPGQGLSRWTTEGGSPSFRSPSSSTSKLTRTPRGSPFAVFLVLRSSETKARGDVALGDGLPLGVQVTAPATNCTSPAQTL